MEIELEDKIRPLRDEKNYRKYWAFISYSRNDEYSARKLRNFIESFEIPNELVEKYGLPENMSNSIFDETLLGGGDLAPQIEGALKQSRYLIVVCSPNSAKSKYVNEEIEYFKSLGGETRILPYIIAGKATIDEDPDCCYGPAIKENQVKHQIVGGNLQETGFEFAAIRIISAMLEVDFRLLYDQFIKNKKRKRSLF